MKKIKVMCGIVFIMFLSVNIYTTTKSVGGGTWEYGAALQGNLSNKCWSNYYHKTKTHGASCTMGANASGIVKKNKNVWSYASAYGSMLDRSATYYYLY